MSVSGYLAKGKRKAPLGLSVGGLFACRHAPEGLGSRTPWNKSSAYVLDTHYKSEIFKSVILSVLYHSRHDLRIYIRKNFVAVSVYTRILFVFEYVIDGISRKLFTAIENTSFGKRFNYTFSLGHGYYSPVLNIFGLLPAGPALFRKIEIFLKNRSNHFEIHLELTDKSSLQNFVTTIRRPGMRLDDIGTNNAYAGSGIIPDRHRRY